MDHIHEPAKALNFSRAFEQMCNVFAISQTKGADETLKALILQCFAILPDENFFTEYDIATAITLFGIQIPPHEVRVALDGLIRENKVISIPGARLTVPSKIRKDLVEKIYEASKLEEKVKDEWFSEVSLKYPMLPLDGLWNSLKEYLGQAFRRHGIQTIALLDPNVDLSSDHVQSLTSLLATVVKKYPSELQVQVRNALSLFMAKAGFSNDRSKFIAQLADGAFNYFSLMVAPDLAEQFRKQLSPLKIFLDTNFIFGIIDLTVSPEVAVSNDLLSAITDFKFPFTLYYHEITKRELLTSIDGYRETLSTRQWSPSISRAAITSPFLSGVEQQYYRKFLETGIDVASFFRKYLHADVLLEQKGINLYRETQNRLKERARLISLYQIFLESKGKTKNYELIDHDMTVLNVVREYRSNSPSTLGAEALLLTCDFQLYMFDWEYSKKNGHPPCTVLPNLFWQVLRPFVPSTIDYDRVFAETFAIPEFRTLGSGSAEACSKVVYIIAGYKDFPEETASRLLSDDMLIERLRSVSSNEEFQQLVDSAIVEENAALVEEKVVLQNQLEQEKTEKTIASHQLEDAKQLLEEKNQEAENTRIKLENGQREMAEKIKSVQETAETALRSLKEVEERIQSEQADRANADERARTAEERYEVLEEKYTLLIRIIKTAITSILLIIGFEYATYNIPLLWLVNHPNSYGIQFCINGIIVFGFAGLFFKKHSGYLWGGAAIAFLVTLAQLVGGPNK